MEDEKTEYPYLKSLLEEGFDDQQIFLTENELEMIASAVRRNEAWKQNVGYRENRCENNPREKAFRDRWLKENEPIAYINHGQGILQDLFIEAETPLSMFSKRYVEYIQPRDRYIVATIIQWLGSNIGWCFLEETLKDCGYKIVRIER